MVIHFLRSLLVATSVITVEKAFKHVGCVGSCAFDLQALSGVAPAGLFPL